MRTLPIGDERVGASSTGDEIVVRSPYDGHEIERVPACGSPRWCTPSRSRSDVPVRERRSPPWERAEILDRAAQPARGAHRGVRPHHRRGGGQADQDRARRGEARGLDVHVRGESRRAGSPARWCRSTRPTSARASSASRCGCRSASSARSARSTSRSTSSRTSSRPPSQPGCPVVLKPASQTPLSAIALAELLLDECGLPAGHLNVVTGSGGTVGNAIVDDPDIALITFTGSPEVGWGIKARAPRKKVGLELGNNAPVIIEPDGDVDHRRHEDLGRRLQPRRAVVHLHAADLPARRRSPTRFLDELVPQGRGAGRRRPARRGDRRVGAHLRRRARAGRGVDRRGGRRRRQGRDRGRRAQRRARADRAHRRAARHEGVQPGGVRSRRRGADLPRRRRRASASPTPPATGCRPRSSPATSRSRSAPHGSSTSAACS